MTAAPLPGWESLSDQSDTRIGFALQRITAALASGMLPLSD
ncbi:hypothetical protein [Streptomyces sp. IMTB 2501]|nr:hypothetical protein [Streptomyces sp. IMTB 2501]